MKSINEDPKFRVVADPLAEIQAELVQKKQEEEANRVEFSRPGKTQDENAFATYLTKEGAFAIDSKTELREKLRANQDRQAFLESALKQGPVELDKVIGQLSLAACKEMRPRWVKALEKQLSALKQICDANAELVNLRDELERAGYETGSLPFCQFKAVEVWESAYGSNVQFHRQYIKQHFPEIDTELKKLTR
jgi:hypothetical protein